MLTDWIIRLAWLAITVPTLLAQLVLARHALREGKVGWAIFIFMAPILGCLAYYSGVYRPALQARRLEEELAPGEGV
jgi:hypothetical protein